MPDVLKAMEHAGTARRAELKAGVVAVTGSVGKTGTKEALRLVLSRFGATHASAASYNNHWGVPLTLARMPAETQFGVFEIGMNHAGEITPLVAMVRPRVAIVTMIAPVHLEYFASLDAIAEAKAEIFSGLENDGVAIINRDVEQFDLLRARAAHSPAGVVMSFGEHADADARLESFTPSHDGSLVVARVLGRSLTYRLAASGRHMAINSLAVLLAAGAVGVEPAEAAIEIGRFEAPAGRGQRLTLNAANGPFTLIDESYNANPTSMSAALSLLGSARPGAGGRRVAVLGDMLELGPESARLHRAIAAAVKANDVDIVHATGPMMKELFDVLPAASRGEWAEKSGDIEQAVIDSIAAGDIVMVKGSNGSRMGPIVASLKARFGERADATPIEG